MQAKIYRNEILDVYARKIIGRYDPRLLHTPALIPIEEIIEKSFNITVEFHRIRNNGRILGEMIFNACTIPIYDDKSETGYKLISVKANTIIADSGLMNNEGRLRYTLAHELSHFVLDKDYFTQTGEVAAFTKNRAMAINKAIERQADKLACRILMPKLTVKKAFFESRKHDNIVETLANLFGVSRQAMEYRLKELGLPQH